MINIFETSFEARERRFQIEKLYHGETVDLVGVVTTNGVPQNITGYAVSGVFQPTSMNGSPDFYELSADIVDNKVIVHWEKGKDFGENSYMVWALLTDGDNASYPIVWRLDMAYSPNFPLSSLAPIPKAIDFSKYDLLNAPWLELSAFDEFVDGLSNEYLPLSGGVVSGDFAVENFLSSTSSGVFLGKNQDLNQYAELAIGNNLSVGMVGLAMGSNSEARSNDIAIGHNAKSPYGGGNIVIGNDASTAANGTTVVGTNAKASGGNAIAIGTAANATHSGEVRLGGPQGNLQPQLWLFDTPILSGPNTVLLPERVPYLSGYAKKEEIPEVPTDLSAFTNSPGYLTAHQSLEDYYTKTQTDEKLSAYAQLSDLENIDVPEISACLSSDEFTDVEELSAAEFVSLQDIVDKMNLVIQKLKRTWRNPSYTYIKYSDNTELPMNLTGIYKGNIPNIENVTDVEIGTAVTDIGGFGPFEGSALSSLVIPETVTYCGTAAFGGCPSLTSIEIISGHNLNFNNSFLGCSATVTFDGRTKAEVSSAGNYPWGIPTGQGRIVCTDGTL